MKIKPNYRTALLLAVPALAMVATVANANHSWGNYHWPTPDGVATPDLVDNTQGAWKMRVAFASGDWNASAHINSVLSTSTTNQKRCPMTSGTIQVCNSAYGQTGWLGIASISVSGDHIVAGSTKLNDTYFAYPQYNTENWKQLVTCQEIGHNYGLGHQNEDFNTHLTSSCMEYTSDPVGNEHPDGHDYDQLDTIYNHVDDTSGGGSSSGGPGNGKGGGKGKKLGIESGNSPAEWGKAIAQDASGRDSVYARNVNGYTVITHVTWAIGEGPGPRRHSGDHHFD